MRRIAVIGSGGAGKSTFSRELGGILGIEVTHLDHLYWRPGWRAMPDEAWRATQRRLLAGDAWILDGNYGGTLDLRLAAADTVIFLDIPRWVCVRGVVARWLRFHGRSRPDGPAGCPERVTREFLAWIWRYPVDRRPGVLAKLAAYADGREIVILRSRREARRFLIDLERSMAAAASRAVQGNRLDEANARG
jgi:adenylate kinase family enzyme